MDPERQADEPSVLDRPAVQVGTWTLLGVLVVGVALAIGLPAGGDDTGRAYELRRVLDPEPEPELRTGPGPSEEYYPCTDCHDETTDVNPKRRTLEDDHDDLELDHGDLWCLSCHSPEARDSLQLSDGARVDFEASWQLCTQCHGEKRADWRAGVHGKRLGHWYGPKQVFTCVECHAPHAPRFQSLPPLAPPQRPTPRTFWLPASRSAPSTVDGAPGAGGEEE